MSQLLNETCSSSLNISMPESPRPFLKWVGGKSQLLSEILEMIPRYQGKYFEPFVGGGAVFFNKLPQNATLIDVNAELINAYKVVRDDVEHLILELQKYSYEKNHYYKIRNADRLLSFKEWSSVERAARLIFLNKTCFNGLYRVNSKGQFNVPFGRYTNPTIVDSKNLRACSYALSGIDILEDNFYTVEELAQAGDFVYFDPPYAPLNTTSNFTAYSKNGFTIEEQKSLRDLCLRLAKRKIACLVSNSDAPLIRELYSDSRFKVKTVYASRSVNSNACKRGKIPELLIANY